MANAYKKFDEDWKRSSGFYRDHCELRIDFSDGASLLVEAEGYEGTRLVLSSEAEEKVVETRKVRKGIE